ncbi:MAG: ABC transporter ATP-binding protein [Ruminococcus sp.]|nr:ABC transporter ATP-binding protein [Ruminococcus sp.]
MIKINNVSKEYEKGGVKAVDSLTWEVEDGKITGFIGPNGAGKSTTLKMITGVIFPTQGSITINGIDISAQPIEAKRQFAFVSDTPDNFLKLKGIEYLNFVADIYGVSSHDRKERITTLAERFEMTNALNKTIADLSHGMRQKMMLMGALIHMPPVWILDEPLVGLDPNSAHILKEMMKEHAAKGNTVLFSTHVLEVAEKLCDKIAIINKGKLVYSGTLEHLKEKYSGEDSLENIFLEVVKNV